jgi:tetratricopeptide (TPR) repeat protein
LFLVAEFDGPSGDEDIAPAARALVTAALEQSQTVTPVSPSRLKRTLQLAMRPDTTRVIGDVAREVAYRAGARVYVEGRVDRIMKGYSIVLRASDSESDSPVATVSAVAESEATFISTLDRLGRELRMKLGEKSETVQRTLPFRQVFTPSLEAYQWKLRATSLNASGNAEGALPLIKRALALDPDFAEAYASLGTIYSNLGFADSAEIAWKNVLARPERMTEARYMFYKARYLGSVKLKYTQALKAYQVLLNHPSCPRPVVLSDMGNLLRRMGRFEEALDMHRREEIEQRPDPPDGILLSNQFRCLMHLGRVEEARGIAKMIDENFRPRLELQLSLAESDWVRAETQAERLANDLLARASARFEARQTLASMAALRGEVQAAAQAFEWLAPEAPSPPWREEVCLARLQIQITTPQSQWTAATASCRDTTIASLVLAGIQAASQGDTALAKDCLGRASAKPLDRRRRYQSQMALLLAWVAAASERWEQAISNLEQPTSSGEVPVTWGGLWMYCARWLVADCEERLGHLENAARGFQRVLSPQAAYEGLYHRGIFYPFAHHRLVLLYSKMGRVEDARRHWEIFERTFTNPDPELVPMVEEARRALEEAEAKAAS